MDFELTQAQCDERASFKVFVESRIAPCADRFDHEQRVPPELIAAIAKQGYLGAAISSEHGGGGMDQLTFGLLHEEFGRGSSSVQSLLTVHSMVAHALARWGNGDQKACLAAMARGDVIGAFCLSEPETGSDARSVRTTARAADGGYILAGTKRWITFGQVATLFLVLAQLDGQPTAFLVGRENPGVIVSPIRDMLGFRSAMLAEVCLEDCRVGPDQLVGRAGFGLSHVFGAALDLGRYSVACGCVGLAQACLDESLGYAKTRRQFGKLLADHQLVQRMLSRMVANVAAARSLCRRAGWLRSRGDPRAIRETMIAKYFASKAANDAAADAVQILGANGCSSEFPVQRYYRDARIMEIIEGSSQIHEIMIARGTGSPETNS